MTKRLFTMSILATGGFASEAAAQGLAVTPETSFYFGSFLMALVAGILLALAFQLVLSLISMATGVSAVGNIEERLEHSHAQKNFGDTESKSHPDPLAIVKKMIHGMGVWSAITTVIALFAASWLAIQLAGPITTGMAITMGLAIWAGFTLITMMWEMKVSRSLAGHLWSTAINGFKTVSKSFGGMLGHSPDKRAEKVALHTVSAIRKEMTEMLHDRHVTNKLDQYVRQLQPPHWSLKDIRHEMAKLIDEITVNEEYALNDEGEQRKLFFEVAERHSKFSKKDVSKLGRIYDEISEANREKHTRADKLVTTLEKVTPGSEEDTRHALQKIANYLVQTQSEALNPESLKQDLERILESPRSIKQVAANRIKQFDHATMVSVVESTNKVPHEKAEQLVSRFENVLNKLQDKKGHSPHPVKDGQHRIKEKLRHRLHEYFDSLDRPELQFETLEHDMDRIFADPKHSVAVLKERLSTFNRETAVAVLSSRSNMSRQEAERLVDKFEANRERLIHKAEEIEAKVQERYQQVRKEAVHQAEMVRECTVAAAGWSATAMVLSASAAVLGSLTAI